MKAIETKELVCPEHKDKITLYARELFDLPYWKLCASCRGIAAHIMVISWLPWYQGVDFYPKECWMHP